MPKRALGVRIGLALAIGAVAGVLTFSVFEHANARAGRGPLGQDFTLWWRGAQAVRAGLDPYTVVRVEGRYPFDFTFQYPLTAAVATVPLAHVRADLAAAIFVGAGFALAAFGLLTISPWRLPILLSGPAILVLGNGQWAPLLLGAALVPWFGFLLACKPTIGAALFLWRPDRRAFWGGLAFGALCLAVQPTWPLDWLRYMGSQPNGIAQYQAPITLRGGALLALALLRWRRPEARLLAALACVPQNYFLYDQLYLLMIPQTARSALWFTLWASIVFLARAMADSAADTVVRSAVGAPYALWGLFVPCLLMVLSRPNEGPAPAWLERWLAQLRVPGWLRGGGAIEEAS